MIEHVEVKEEMDVFEDISEEETCSENGQSELNNPMEESSRDPLDITLKPELASDDEEIKRAAKSRKKVPREKEVFRCEICKEVYFKQPEFFRHKFSHTYDAQFTCLICHYVFKTKLGIVDHMLVFHKNLLEFGCNICHTRFAVKEELEKHRLTHEDIKDRPFQCGLCSLRFVSRNILNTHKLTHSIKRSIACDVCHRQCATIVALVNHRRSHELIKCNKCPKWFDKNTLNRHKKKVHLIGLFKCDICLDTFDDATALNTHKFSHIGNKIVFECTTCKKSFDNIQKRNKHELIHNREKIYQCDKCYKRYQYFSQLQKHYRDHPDHTNNKEVNQDKAYKPIECKICHKIYTQHIGLRNHMKTHSEQKDYECDICHKRFYTRYVLRDHLRIHTGEKPFKCKMCPKKFRTGTNLNYHIATHSKDIKFDCANCDKQYARKGKLKEHIRKTHSVVLNNDGKAKRVVVIKINLENTRKLRPRQSPRIAKDTRFECTICHRRFKLKQSLLLHKVVHEKAKQYECDVCYEQFERKRARQRHKKVHHKKKVHTEKTAVRVSEKKIEESHSYTLICNNVMRTVINPLSLKKKREKIAK